MLPDIEKVSAAVRDAERTLSRDVRERQRLWGYRVHRGRVWFDEEARRAHAEFQQSLPAFLRQGRLSNLLTAPIIYSLSVPLLLLDIWVTTYQWICFPIYRVPLVPRRRYFVIDRHKLAYLNAIEKAHCFYCSYATGLIEYVREIAARTEQYWCPIKHVRPLPAPHARYDSFFSYGDAVGYRNGLTKARANLRKRSTPKARSRHS
jgi:hypothetical protein